MISFDPHVETNGIGPRDGNRFPNEQDPIHHSLPVRIGVQDTSVQVRSCCCATDDGDNPASDSTSRTHFPSRIKVEAMVACASKAWSFMNLTVYKHNSLS